MNMFVPRQPRFITVVDASMVASRPSWLVVDTLTSDVVKRYTDESAQARASEVAECKNFDADQSIFG